MFDMLIVGQGYIKSKRGKMKQTSKIITDTNEILEITITESYKRSIKIKKVTPTEKK